jgi:hypothetical protein
MVVDVGFPPVLLVEVPVGDVDVVEGRMVVIVRVGGQQMSPVLTPVQVVRYVIVLVPVLHGLVLVMTLWLRHRAHLFRVAAPSRTDRTSRAAAQQTDRRNARWPGST